jgi:type II secretory pathway pseudopilin PulG
MKQAKAVRTSHRAQAGYALLMIMFILALMVVTMSAAAPTILSSIQREREKEMVWRGKQYTRGIRLYYLKTNRFPTSLDDLTKPKTGIRFMRQAYKDPMNLVDGSWRLIYVGPNGQLIGSLSDRSIGLNGSGTPGVGGGLFGSQGQGGGGILGGASSINGGSGSSFGSTFGSSFGGNQGSNQIQPNGAAGSTNTTLAPGTPGANSQSSSSFDDPLQPHSLAGPMDASNTIGGNIIGVGSKIDKKSFLIYEKAKTYKLFEFIWDPSKDTSTGRASVGIGAPVGNTNGMNPAGGISNGGSPFSQGQGMNPGMGQNPAPGMGQNPSPAGSNPNPNNPDPNTIPPLQAPQQ